MALKFTEEFIREKVAKGFPESMFRGDDWQKEQHYKKNNPVPKHMADKLNGLKNEGFSGRRLDEFLDLDLNDD